MDNFGPKQSLQFNINTIRAYGLNLNLINGEFKV